MVGAGSRARRPLLALAVAIGIALAAAPTLAHHSRAMFKLLFYAIKAEGTRLYRGAHYDGEERNS
jgi:hypothetical protein